ncbi:MAG: hypothetical protein ACLKAK_01870 [Alkaliphilus sp.]
MRTISSILGYNLEEALNILHKEDFCVTVKKSFGKKLLECGKPRVIKQESISENQIELVISYF